MSILILHLKFKMQLLYKEKRKDYNMRLIKLFFIVFSFLFMACSSAQINQTLGSINEALGEDELTNEQVGSGLKEALIKGVTSGSNQASQLDGYYKNPLIKIGFPPDVDKVQQKLRQIGLGSEVDKFVLSLNRGAEEAAKEAKPIFFSAVKSMSIQDVWGILKGGDDAATQYLVRTTSDQLKSSFQPVMDRAMGKSKATQYYSDLVNTYNKIPFVDKVNSDLSGYATDQAVEGLFKLIAEEEKNIRKNPLARTTDLLKKVFAKQD
jgi:hypothetical protein